MTLIKEIRTFDWHIHVKIYNSIDCKLDLFGEFYSACTCLAFAYAFVYII